MPFDMEALFGKIEKEDPELKNLKQFVTDYQIETVRGGLAKVGLPFCSFCERVMYPHIGIAMDGFGRKSYSFVQKGQYECEKGVKDCGFEVPYAIVDEDGPVLLTPKESSEISMEHIRCPDFPGMHSSGVHRMTFQPRFDLLHHIRLLWQQIKRGERNVDDVVRNIVAEHIASKYLAAKRDSDRYYELKGNLRAQGIF